MRKAEHANQEVPTERHDPPHPTHPDQVQTLVMDLSPIAKTFYGTGVAAPAASDKSHQVGMDNSHGDTKVDPEEEALLRAPTLKLDSFAAPVEENDTARVGHLETKDYQNGVNDVDMEDGNTSASAKDVEDQDDEEALIPLEPKNLSSVFDEQAGLRFRNCINLGLNLIIMKQHLGKIED